MRRDVYVDGPPLVQWRAVFAGLVIGLGVLALLSALWAAIGFGTHQGGITTNFRWWEAGSAIFSMFLGAYFAAVFAGIRGPASGLANSATLWGTSVLGVILVGIPAVMRIFSLQLSGLSARSVGTAANATASATGVSPHAVLWTTFWAIVIGLGAALLGGLVGGTMPRRMYAAAPGAVYDEPATVETHRRHRRAG
jgi:hypothetical protein